MELIDYNKFKKILCAPPYTLSSSMQSIVGALMPANISSEEKELLSSFYIRLITTDYELAMLLDSKDKYNNYMFVQPDIAFINNANIDMNKIKQSVESLCLVPVTRDFSILDLFLIALKQLLVSMA